MVSNWARATFSSLGNRHYRIFWLGSTLAFLAFMMSMIVQSIVAFDLTGKNGAVGFVSLGMGIATVGIAPFGGVIADRVSKRRLIFIGQAIIGSSFLFIGVLIVTDNISIWWLAASTFLLGAVFSFIGPARQAWIGDLLPPSELANGIAVQQMAMTGTRIVGPLLVGVMVAFSFIGTGGVYLLMGGLFVFVLLTLAYLPGTQGRPRGTGPSVLADFRLGLQHVLDRPRLKVLALSFIGVILGGFSYQVVLPGLLENELGHDARDMGLMFGVSAISGLAVTLVVAGHAGSRHAPAIMTAAGLVLGVSIIFTGLAPNFGYALGAMLLVGAGGSGFQLLNNALVMQESDPAYYGRVMSLTMMAWGANGLAALPFGALADSVGERLTLMVMGSVVLAVVIVSGLVQPFLARRPRTPIPAPEPTRPGQPVHPGAQHGT